MPPDPTQVNDARRRLVLPSLSEARCSDSQGRDTHAEGPPGRDGVAIPQSPAHLLTCSPAQAPPAAPSPSHRITVSPSHSPLSPRDRELLNALDDPATIDPFEYAEWIERPEIQRAIAARDNLRAREEHAKLTRFRDRVLTEASAALDTLKATLEKNKDTASDNQQLEARRAATTLTRLAQACLRPLSPSSPLGGGERRSREVGALSTPASPTRSTGRASAPSSGQQPTANGQQPSSRILASSVPGLETAIAQFLRAVGTPGEGSPTAKNAVGGPAATRLIANHRAMELGDKLPAWLESKVAPLRATAHPTRVIYHDGHDLAEQFVELTHPDGARSTCVIEAVLERLPDLTPTRWAIADITHDTS